MGGEGWTTGGVSGPGVAGGDAGGVTGGVGEGGVGAGDGGGDAVGVRGGSGVAEGVCGGTSVGVSVGVGDGVGVGSGVSGGDGLGVAVRVGAGSGSWQELFAFRVSEMRGKQGRTITITGCPQCLRGAGDAGAGVVRQGEGASSSPLSGASSAVPDVSCAAVDGGEPSEPPSGRGAPVAWHAAGAGSADGSPWSARTHG
ncbi:hypothetical protein GCM10017673_10630 [Streptosporangium violaceochromogenes]|nr:hypothetical protein GCM10017673_10630 [Streptosporangium violaceochromogenes]